MSRLFLLIGLFLAWPSAAQITATDAFPGVTFESPVELAMAPGQPERVYIVEQGTSGRARVVTLERGDSRATVYVDLDGRVRTGGEQGLLGLAFHPDYDSNGRVFVHYNASNPRRSVISELSRSASNPLMADAESERVLLEVEQPFGNHNGGKIGFGPDGYLYIGLGDGGSQGDPQNNSQDASTLLGSLLRIDVDNVPNGEPYGIPPDNPFAMTDGPERDEVYAYGLRNPWKFSFDSETGDLWLGDVGQNRWEEINLIESGGNYGWRPVEGPSCFISGCDLSAYIPPVFAYQHNSAGGFSVTGGMVYRGTSVAGLEGRYLFADFVSPRLWALNSGATAGSASSTLLVSTLFGISSINEGPGKEAYVLTYNSGTIYVLGGSTVSSETGPEDEPLIRVEGANPVRGSVTLAVSGQEGGHVRLSLHDVLGREVQVLHTGTAVSEVRVSVDATALAPGAYFVYLETPTHRAVQQIVVAR